MKLTNKEPTIVVKQEIKKIENTNPYIHDVVCLIGAMETAAHNNEPTLFTDIEAAREVYGTDASIDGNSALEILLEDDEISGLLVVNITTMSGETAQRNLTETKLKDALNSLDLIDFDTLYIASDLTDTFIEKVKEFTDKRFESKNPVGYTCAVNRTSISAYETTAEKVGDFCYALINQKLNVDNEDLTLVESGAFVTKQIALTPISDSLTAKEMPEITGLQDTYLFGKDGNGNDNDGKILTGVGYLLFRLINATTNTYEAVNSANHNGLDLYISRSRDVIVKEFALRSFLGDKGQPKTIELVKMQCNKLYSRFKSLGIIEGMNYAVQKADAETVDVIINTIQFAGVITTINVSITVEVV